MPFDISHESTDFIVKLLVSAILGGLIGLERDIHGRAAGLRTHLLVSMGSAVFMILSVRIPSGGGDPGRIAAQIVTGIGFLGAGTIIKEGFTIRGLTTASCLWVASGIGMAAGAGYFLIALTVAVITLFSLIALNHFEKAFKKDSYRMLEIAVFTLDDVSAIIDILKKSGLKIIYFDIDKNYDEGLSVLKFFIRIHQKGITDKLSHRVIETLEKTGVSLKYFKWGH